MNVSAANTAVFGNVDMWLINNDSISRELRFMKKAAPALIIPASKLKTKPQALHILYRQAMVQVGKY